MTKFLDSTGLGRLVANIKAALNGKQGTISDLETIRNGASKGATAYQKPSSGIPKSDLESAVQTSLGKADTALQSYTETDPTVPTWAKQSTKPSYDYSEINNTPTLATVATSGSYNDLSSKPTIPTVGTLNTNNTTAQTASSSESLSGAVSLHKVSKTGSYNDLLNRPTIPTVNNATLTIQKNGTNVATFTANASTGATANITVPTATSDLTNDSGFITGYTETDPVFVASAAHGIASSDITAWNNKQDALTAGDGIAIDSEDTIRTTGIPFGVVDSTSTSTNFTITVAGIYKLEDGVCFMAKNGVVTSAANFVINVNGLGGKPCYTNLAAATRDTTIFNVNYTMLFVYDSTRVTGGGWICYRGYDSDSNTNTVGYLLRGNNSTMKTTDASRYYKIFFTSADGTHWVPASVNSTNNATSARPVNQRPIDPFGRIMYTSANTNYPAGSTIAVATLWSQYPLSLGYSFNVQGGDLTLTASTPVYIKCAPQSDGSAIIDSTTPYVQALPTTNDGKIYIFLGIAYNATNIELYNNHPVYYHDGTGIRLWTGKDVQDKLVSGTNIKTINNESLLGSGNIDIQGGGSSISITYNANTQALVIGSGSVNTYTITFSDNGTIVDMEINEQSTQHDRVVEINEGDSFYCRVTDTGNSGNTVVMGGVDITSSALTLITKNDGPMTEYECQISIPSVTGDVSIVVSSNGSYNPYN